jgi:hypothetical protein
MPKPKQPENINISCSKGTKQGECLPEHGNIQFLLCDATTQIKGKGFEWPVQVKATKKCDEPDFVITEVNGTLNEKPEIDKYVADLRKKVVGKIVKQRGNNYLIVGEPEIKLTLKK